MPVVVACALGVAIGLLFLWRSALGAITIAVAKIEDGQLQVTRGGLSQRVLQDLREIAGRPPIRRATVRVVRARERARIEVRGEVSPQQVQRMRNVIGILPVSGVIGACLR